MPARFSLLRLVCVLCFCVISAPLVRAVYHNPALSVSTSADGPLSGVVIVPPSSTNPHRTPLTLSFLQNSNPQTGDAVLDVTQGADKISVYDSKTGGSALTMPKSWSVSGTSFPKTVYVQGISASGGLNDVSVEFSYTDNNIPRSKEGTLTVVEVAPTTSHINRYPDQNTVPAYSIPAGSSYSNEQKEGYGITASATFDLELKITPSTAIDLIKPRLVQVGTAGSVAKYYRNPPQEGITKSTGSSSGVLWDGEFNVGDSPVSWSKQGSGQWSTLNIGSADVPKLEVFCLEWNKITLSLDFLDYVQFSVDNGKTWVSVLKGEWTFLGGASAGDYSSATGDYPISGFSSVVVTSDFSSYTEDFSVSKTPSFHDSVYNFSDQ